MKSKEQLDSFIAYCEAHPSERFWQALRNWSEYNFIFGSMDKPLDRSKPETLKDTFYL